MRILDDAARDSSFGDLCVAKSVSVNNNHINNWQQQQVYCTIYSTVCHRHSIRDSWCLCDV